MLLNAPMGAHRPEETMKKRNLLITLAVVATLAAVPILYADMHHGQADGHGGCGFGFLGHLQHLKSELNLSDDQSTQLQSVVKGVREQNAPYREEIKKNLHEVASLLLANPGDTAGAQAILDRSDAAERQLKTNMLQGASKALSLLTPDQRTKLSEHIARRMSRG